MFYHLEGIVKSLSSDSLVIDCGGVGFEVSITPNTASAVTLGSKAKIFVTESIG